MRVIFSTYEKIFKMNFTPHSFKLSDLENNTVSQLTGNKLPTKLHVLQLFLRKRRNENLSLTESVHETTQQIKNFWDRATVKMKRDDHCCEKLKILYNELLDLKKINKPSKKKERFIHDLFDVFDISHADLFKLIEESEKNVFLSQSIDDIKKSLTNLRLSESQDK